MRNRLRIGRGNIEPLVKPGLLLALFGAPRGKILLPFLRRGSGLVLLVVIVVGREIFVLHGFELILHLCAEQIGVRLDRNAGEQQEADQKPRDRNDVAQRIAAEHIERSHQQHTEHAAADAVRDRFVPRDRELLEPLREVVAESVAGRAVALDALQRLRRGKVQNADDHIDGNDRAEIRSARALPPPGKDHKESEQHKQHRNRVRKDAGHAKQEGIDDRSENTVGSAVQVDAEQRAERDEHDPEDLNRNAFRAGPLVLLGPFLRRGGLCCGRFFCG